MKKVNIQCYICDKCGKIYNDEYLAEICCKQYLIDFIDNWNKKNGRDLYYCDQGIVILIDKEDYQK